MFEYTGEALAVLTSNSFPDSNNNTTISGAVLSKKQAVEAETRASGQCEKYLLRPRSLKRPPLRRCAPSPSLKCADGAASPGATPKQKSAPLSKYRRKTANARERSRMREINVAFETLRKAVPLLFAAQQGPGVATPPPQPTPSEKLTKITTLRLAMRYIAALNATLQTSAASPLLQLPPTCDAAANHQVDLDAFLLESSDADSLCTTSDGSIALPDHSVTSIDFTASIFDDSLSPAAFNEHPFTFDPFFTAFS